MTRALVREEGLLCGGSSGAAVAGAIRYAERLGNEKKHILVLLPDGAQKYLSKIFNDDWMRENGFLDEEDPLGTVSDLLRGRPRREIITANKGATIREVINLLKEHSISQVPVIDDNGRLCGLVAEVDLLNQLLVQGGSPQGPIEPLIESDYATVTPQTKIRLLKTIFNDAKMVCVLDRDPHEPPDPLGHSRDALVGVITKIDLIDYLAARSGSR
jgi:cystathionine beta-synthase